METEREAIVDWEWENNVLSVVPLTTDPTKNGIVVLNADWSNV